MPTKIITKNGSGVPSAASLEKGELAIDLTNKRLYTENAGGTVIELGVNPTTVTATQVTIDNGSNDGGEVVFKSSGFSDWNVDNFDGALRTFSGGTVYTTVSTTGLAVNGAITQGGNAVLDAADLGVSVQAYDANTAKINVNQAWTAAQRTATQTASVTGATTLDFDTYQNFVLTLTGNVTLSNPTTEAIGQTGFIVFTQDGTGGRTVSLGTDYKTAAAAGLTLSATASAIDVVPYIVSATGSILLGTPQLGFA